MRILNVWIIPVRLLLAFINVSRQTVDSIICKLIDNLIGMGLYEPRLTQLLTSLEGKYIVFCLIFFYDFDFILQSNYSLTDFDKS